MRVIKESCKKCLQLASVKRQFPHLSGYQPLQATGFVATQEEQDNINLHYYCLIPSDVNKSYLSDLSDIIGSGITNFLKKNKSTSDGQLRKFYVDSKKNFYQKSPNENKKPLPRLLYIQNPLVWVSNKLDFRFLRISWDPFFNEAEFTKGARQAVSTITQMVSKNKFDSMKPLLTKNALLNLRRDVEIIWAEEVRRNIGLEPEDVQLIIPRKLHFRNAAEPKLLDRGIPSTHAMLTPVSKTNDKKFCDIDVLFIGLKWLQEHRFQETPLCFVDIVARFHRNYTEGLPPDWTVSAFKVRRFNLIPQRS